MRVLITGASGFIGRSLTELLCARGFSTVVAIRRDPSVPFPRETDSVHIGDIGPATQWKDALLGVDAVVHLAGRVHVMKESDQEGLTEYLKVNAEGTRNLAQQAAASGAKRFIYISSLKVHGERDSGHPISEADTPTPVDAYSVSKMRAEHALHSIGAETDLEVVTLRPPLVYGPGVGGNFRTLLSWCRRPLPVPVPKISNQRSLIYVENLSDAIIRCLAHPAAPGHAYVLRDGEDVSTAGLVRLIRSALGAEPRILRVPTSIFRLAGAFSGSSIRVSRLIDSLRVDDSKIRDELDWHPPFTIEQGISRTTDWFNRNRPAR